MMENVLSRLRAGEPVFWRNPKYECGKYPAEFTLKDMLDAEARLARFAPLLAQLFDEAAEHFGIIESRLLDVPKLAAALCGVARILLKADHDLPVAGSVKARGGIYNVLCFAESLCLKNGLLQLGDDYRKLAEPEIRRLFGRYTVAVGSTGNLGLSIGTIASALGFRARVHMSADAKEWKKRLLRSRGVEVLEYGGDYSTAVAQGRREAERDPYSYFVDDENSPELFLGYAVAAFRLRDQLRLRGICPTPEQPLFVYLPCGVGGAPGGICFGLKMLFGKAVHCFFAEPVQSPCMTLGLVSGKHDGISVYDIGLTNRTLADGLAVGRPSAFVGKIVRNLVSGCFTVRDEALEKYQRLVRATEGLKIEPSAAAGFAGPGMVLASDYLREQGLTPDRILHLLWTTGGRYLPE